MRTSKIKSRGRALGLALLLAALALPVHAQQTGRAVPFKSPQAAYEQGMGAWRAGFTEHAVPALRFAAEKGVFLAQFYLARIYSDNGTAYTDHGAAYRLYLKIANDNLDIDPDDDQRAPFVARALVALATYLKAGIPQIAVSPDPMRASEYLRHAATFFNNEDAQFELAKLYLEGDGVAADPRYSMHWLSVLAQRGHAGAQAFLADIYWRGRYMVPRDPLRAFALITVAVDNAPDAERVWIEDIYQNIYCGAGSGTRTQAQGMVADWRRKYSRNVTSTDRMGLGALPPRANRSCGNGEPVTLSPQLGDTAQRPASSSPTTMQGSVMGFGLKDAGAKGVAGTTR